MPRQERSAGFVLFRSDASVPGGRAFLLLDYGRHWDYAKGHVEAGETDLVAARRELREETGITDITVVDGFSHEIEYYFRKGKQGLVLKKVIFFLASTTSTAVTLSDEHVDYAYVDYATALKRLTYGSAREVLKRAEKFLVGTKSDETGQGSSDEATKRRSDEGVA
jgi:bis(5'-nucleosidyl)-tetraphosphatase